MAQCLGLGAVPAVPRFHRLGQQLDCERPGSRLRRASHVKGRSQARWGSAPFHFPLEAGFPHMQGLPDVRSGRVKPW